MDGLAEFLRQANHERPGNEVEVDARGRGEPDQRRAQSHARCRRGGNDELLGAQGVDNSLHRGASQIYALSDLRQAQSGLLALERTQNARGPGDDLNALSAGAAFRGNGFGPVFFSHQVNSSASRTQRSPSASARRYFFADPSIPAASAPLVGGRISNTSLTAVYSKYPNRARGRRRAISIRPLVSAASSM